MNIKKLKKGNYLFLLNPLLPFAKSIVKQNYRSNHEKQNQVKKFQQLNFFYRRLLIKMTASSSVIANYRLHLSRKNAANHLVILVSRRKKSLQKKRLNLPTKHR